MNGVRSVVSVRWFGPLLVVASLLAAVPPLAGASARLGGTEALPPAPPSAASLPGQFVVAAPGGWVSTFATQVVAVEQGGALAFLNADIMYHDVVAKDAGPDTQPWCVLYAPARPCPLFWTPTIGGFGESTPVFGLENLVPGTVYEYYCTEHPGMTGRLVAVPSVG